MLTLHIAMVTMKRVDQSQLSQGGADALTGNWICASVGMLTVALAWVDPL